MKNLRSLSLATALVLLTTAPSVAAAAEESGSETHALDAGGRVSLSNVNGPVTIEGWDNQDVQIDWTKTARHAEDLDRMEVRIEASGRWIEIETHYEKNRSRWGDNHSGEVEYRIRVPRTALLEDIETVNGRLEIEGVDGDVKASTVNGHLEARELGGSVELETVNGSIDAFLSQMQRGNTVDLETVNGSLELTIPAGSGADIDVETVNGRIRNDFGLEVQKGRYVGRSLTGSIGGGGSRVRIESVNGSVSIRRGN